MLPILSSFSLMVILHGIVIISIQIYQDSFICIVFCHMSRVHTSRVYASIDHWRIQGGCYGSPLLSVQFLSISCSLGKIKCQIIDNRLEHHPHPPRGASGSVQNPFDFFRLILTLMLTLGMNGTIEINVSFQASTRESTL